MCFKQIFSQCKEKEYLDLYNKEVKLNFDLNDENVSLIAENEGLKKLFVEGNPKKEFWNTKYPKANILYMGRVFPTTKTMLEIDVRLFVTPIDFKIKEALGKEGLFIEDKDNCDLKILQIYKTHQKLFSYAYDQTMFGIPELWMFPHELWANVKNGKGADCDDWGNSLASYYIAAGVPEWRVRCVAGTTWGNEGHLTVYVLADDLVTWVHTNSTTPLSMIKATRLIDLPHNHDETDNIGIKDVWFSYNNLYAWHEFVTDASEKGYKKDGKKFKIIT